MSITQTDIDFVYEVFAPLGDLTHRKMMGGLTLYHHGQVFAILSADTTLYLKAKGAFADKMAAAGAVKFSTDNGRTMGYWTLPTEALDNPDIATDWAQQALAAL